MRRKGAFTLIELLVVVAIIALLVSMLLPTLAKAREIAKKGVCSSQLRGHGQNCAIYVSENNSYPHYGPNGIGVPGFWYENNAWPKIFGVMEAGGIQGTHRSNWGVYAYFWEADEVWPGALCPGMDAIAVWNAAERARDAGRDLYDGKPDFHKAAVGYQWNVTLRAAHPLISPGRWPNYLEGWPEAGAHDYTLWIDWIISLPGAHYGTQAVNPEEVDMPQAVAEAWDSCDVGTAPHANIQGSWSMECLVPGWHVGPMSAGTNGWALLSSLRHPNGPNILYADGHVASDARHTIRANELGGCPSGSWSGIKAVSWDDYKEEFGTMWHIVPQRRFQ